MTICHKLLSFNFSRPLGFLQVPELAGRQQARAREAGATLVLVAVTGTGRKVSQALSHQPALGLALSESAVMGRPHFPKAPAHFPSSLPQLFPSNGGTQGSFFGRFSMTKGAPSPFSSSFEANGFL